MVRKILGLLKSQPPSGEFIRSDYRTWIFVVEIFILAFLIMGFVEFVKVDLVGHDAYFHTGYAKVLAEHGPMDTFRWNQASVLKNRYVDKEFLFHVLLIPFLGNEMRTGPKLLTVILAAALFALLAWVATRHRAPWPWLWPSVALASGGYFLFRLNLTRPHMLSILLTVWASHLISRRHYLGIFIISVAYPLAYTAAHMLPMLAGVYLFSAFVMGDKIPWKIIWVVLAGTILGFLLHPNRANILYLWWVQNVWGLLNGLSMGGDIGAELGSRLSRYMLQEHWILAGFGITVLSGFMLNRIKVRTSTVFFFFTSCGFGVLYLSFMRFVNYWVVFFVLFLACASRDMLNAPEQEKGFAFSWIKSHRWWRAVISGIAISALLFQAVYGVLESRLYVANNKTPKLKQEAKFISKNVPGGDTVFTCEWDSFPFLFHYAPGPNYLVGMDPTFMQVQDPQLYEQWTRMCSNKAKELDPYQLITNRFQASWALVEKRPDNMEFLNVLEKDDRFHRIYEGKDGVLFHL